MGRGHPVGRHLFDGVSVGDLACPDDGRTGQVFSYDGTTVALASTAALPPGWASRRHVGTR